MAIINEGKLLAGHSLEAALGTADIFWQHLATTIFTNTVPGFNIWASQKKFRQCWRINYSKSLLQPL